MKKSKLALLVLSLAVILSFGTIVSGESINNIEEKSEVLDLEEAAEIENIEEVEVIENVESSVEDKIEQVSDGMIRKKLEKGKSYRIENRSNEDLSDYIKLTNGYLDYRYLDKQGNLEYRNRAYLSSFDLDGQVEYVVTLRDDKIMSIPEDLLNKDIFIEESNEKALKYIELEERKNYRIENRGNEDLSDYIKLTSGYLDYRYLDKYGDLEYRNRAYLNSFDLDGQVEHIVTLRDNKTIVMPYHKYEEHYNKDLFIEESNEKALKYIDLEERKNYRIENRSNENLSDYIKLTSGYLDYRYLDKYGDLEYRNRAYLNSFDLDGQVEHIVTLRDNKTIVMPYHKYEEHYNKDLFIEESNEKALKYIELEKGKNYRIENRSNEDLSDYIKLTNGYLDYRYLDKDGNLRYRNRADLNSFDLDGQVEHIVTLKDNKTIVMPYHKYKEHYNKDIFIDDSLVGALYKENFIWKKPLLIENISKGNDLKVDFGIRGQFNVRNLDHNNNLIDGYSKNLNSIMVPANSIIELTHTSKQDNYLYTPFNNTEEYLIVNGHKELIREYKEFPGKDISDEKKSWTIEFNQAIDGFTANKRNIYVIDSKGKKFENMNVKTVGKKIILENTGRFTKGETYEVVVEEEVKSVHGKSLTKGSTLTFKLNKTK